MAIAPDLRPRTSVELYDAAIHLCTRGRTAAPALALLGASPVAIAAVTLCYQARLGRPVLAAALLLTLALFFRYICLGAAALATQDALGGAESSALSCLGRAFRAAPALCISGTVDLALRWIGHPLTLGLAFFFWSDLWCAPAVAVTGRSSPWLIGGAIRRELGGRTGGGMGLRFLHALGFLIVWLNLWFAIVSVLYLGHAFFGLDTTFAMKFCMPDNGLFVVALIAATLTVMEPVRAVTGPLLLADARVRREGLDLREAVERLSATRLAAVLVAVLAATTAQAHPLARHGPVRVRHPHPAPSALPQSQEVPEGADRALEARLERIAERLDVDTDTRVRRELEAARNLESADRETLSRFLDRIDQAADDQDASAKGMFLDGLAEAAKTAPPTPGPSPQAVAKQILSRPEFLPSPERKESELKKEANKEPPPWLERIWKWLRKHLGNDEKSSVEVSLPGLSGGFFRILAVILAAVAIAAVLWLVARVLLAHDTDRVQAEAEGGAGGPAAESSESALSRPPRGWWEQAEILAARGDYRGAIRSVYLALLASLHARGTIDYDPTRSNWDYCRHFRGEGDDLTSFRELTLGFDFAWYGRMGATPDGYERFKSLAQPLMSQPVTP